MFIATGTQVALFTEIKTNLSANPFYSAMAK